MREEIKKARIKKRVLRDYPNAYAEHGQAGIRIMSNDIFIAEEYFANLLELLANKSIRKDVIDSGILPDLKNSLKDLHIKVDRALSRLGIG